MRLETVLGGYAQRYPDKVAVKCGNQRATYRQLYADSLRVAHGFHRMGIGCGDRVLIYVPNGIEFVQAVYGAFAVGAVVVPVNTRLAAAELDYFIEDCAPKALLFHSELRAVVDQTSRLASIPLRLVVGEPAQGITGFAEFAATEASDEVIPEPPVDNDDCMIMYTSGTTGKPKGALITHANLLVQHGYINAIEWGIGADDRYLATTPLAHRTGLGRLVNAFCLGGSLIAMPKFDPAGVIDTIEEDRITVVGMVPTVARMLLPSLREAPERCASLRRIIVTGEAFPVNLKEEIIRLLPQVQLCSFFAMTEVGAVTSLGHQEQFTQPTSVGKPTPGVEVRLIDPDGRDVSPGEVGELLVRSGSPGRYITMKGYYGRPDATAAAIRDGWVYTGDLARRDQEGYLYIVDRKKDMVLSGGFNIYTKEVEQTLSEHPGVEEAAVVGVPDALFGEAVLAFIQPVPGSAPTEADLIEHCKERIASYKKPKYVRFVDALPRNSVGKVTKASLREQALREFGAKDTGA